MKSFIRVAVLFFNIIFSIYENAPAQSESQNTFSSTKGDSRISFLNNLAKAAKLSPLSQKADFNGQRIRLWIPFSHSLGAHLLDIRFGKKSDKIQWFAAWADWGYKDQRE